jgi:hypothetical protein
MPEKIIKEGQVPPSPPKVPPSKPANPPPKK